MKQKKLIWRDCLPCLSMAPLIAVRINLKRQAWQIFCSSYQLYLIVA